MSEAVIKIDNLSKRYMIGRQGEKGDGLRHVLERAARAPFSMFKSKASRGSATTQEFWATKNVSLEIHAGEMVGIIGRNGAGKSTLLKLLSRITEPTSGSIRIRGRVASLLEVGTGFHPELTGRENIFLNGAILGMSRVEIKRKFDDIVEFSEISKFLDTPVKRYSSGMYVRLAFAVAAHLEPEILIVDEVLAVGDAEFQKRCLGKMEDVAINEGRTVILVSHQLSAIQNLCKRCILMDSGQIVFDGKTADTLERYTSRAVGLTSVELSERKDRDGKGDAILTYLKFFDGKGQPASEIISGQNLVIKVGFQVHGDLTLTNCIIGLTVMKDSQPLIVLSTDLADKAPLVLNGAGEVEFVVPDLPFSGGCYHISSYLGSEGSVTQDWVDDAASLDVVDGDFYGSGKIYRDGWQGKVVLVHHSWRICSSSESDGSIPLGSKVPVPAMS